MNCRGFELALESFLTGGLSPAETEAAGRHLRSCDRCGDLLELARIALRPEDPQAAMPPADLVSGVLAKTAGPGCGSAERELCDYVDGSLTAERIELVEAHLSGCAACRGLAATLSALGSELPLLAEIRPDAHFVASVLAATLPWHVRLRRWWHGRWPRWVARPRFAAEAAYVTTLIVALIFSTPGSPLEAMTRRAAEIARSGAPFETIGNPLPRLEAALAPKLEALGDKLSVNLSAGATRTAVATWHGTIDLGSSALDGAAALGADVYGWSAEQFRTFRQWLALMLENDRDSDKEE